MALIIVLAIIAILSIVVLEFSTNTMIETNISTNFHDRVQAEYNARAGLNYAIRLLRDDTNNTDNLQEPWAQPQEIFIGDMVKHYHYDEEEETDTGYYGSEDEEPEPEDCGHGKAYILIIDEDRKLNINNVMTNTLTVNAEFRDILDRLLDHLDYSRCDLDSGDFVEAVIDWIDADEDGLVEADTYYSALPDPYDPANKSLDTVYDLLSVRKMTPRVLYGNTFFPLQETGSESEEEEEAYNKQEEFEPYTYIEQDDPEAIYGLENFITTYSTRNVNVNTAPREVLLAILEDDYSMVSEFMETRLEQPFVDYNQIRAILGTVSEDFSNQKGRYFKIRSSVFRVESIGEYRNSRVKMIAIVRRYAGQRAKVVYQRIENMSMDDEIGFIGENAKVRRR